MASLSDPLVRHLVRLLLRKKTIVCSKSTRKGVPKQRHHGVSDSLL